MDESVNIIGFFARSFINGGERMNQARFYVVQEPNLNFFFRIKIRSFFCIDDFIGKQPLDDFLSVKLKKNAFSIQLCSVNIFTSILFLFQSVELNSLLPFGLNSCVTIRTSHEWDSVAHSCTLNAKPFSNLIVLLRICVRIQQTCYINSGSQIRYIIQSCN